MGRRLRVEYEGAIYHVIQRGNNREYIFAQPNYKEYLIEQLRNAVEADGIDLFAYVVMSNHYHLALRTDKESLSKVMHRINSRYSRYYNSERGRSGHVFEGRYKAIPVEDEKYLMVVLRYIHRNPVRARICSKVSDYRWSSDSAYRSLNHSFVNIDLLLGLMADNRQQALEEYNVFMGTEDNIDCENRTSLGSDGFAMQVEPRKVVKAKIPLDEILIATGASMEEFKLIKAASKKKEIMPYKISYIKAALEHGYSMEEIGRNINISGVAVAKLLNRHKLD